MTRQIGNSRNDSRPPRLPKDPAKREKEMAIREWAKNNGVSIGVARELFREEEETQVQAYEYDWTTADDIISNIHNEMKFLGWGVMSLAQISGTTKKEDFKSAHELWLKLKEAFNAEAATYDPEGFSELGSIGEVGRREVCRRNWWIALNGDTYGDYGTLTSIIEALHHGERLETGEIIFGS